MSVAQKPKQRISFTDAERQMLRRYHKDQPSLTPQQLASWFQGELGRKVSNSSIYDILSEKYAYLDDTEASDTSRRNRGPQWMELEDALFQWWRRVQPRDVTGKELKSRANEIWRTLPACHGKKVPSFSDGLLTNWRERHGLGQAARYADAELAKRGAERPQQVGCVSMITVPKSVKLFTPQLSTQCTPPGHSSQFFDRKISAVALEEALHNPQTSFSYSINQNTWGRSSHWTWLSTAQSYPVGSLSNHFKASSRTGAATAKGSGVLRQHRVKRPKLAASHPMGDTTSQTFGQLSPSHRALNGFNETMWNGIRELYLRCNSQMRNDLAMTGEDVWNVFEPILGSLDFSSQRYQNTTLSWRQESIAASNARKALGLLMTSEGFKSSNIREELQQPILEDWFLDYIDHKVLRGSSLALATVEGNASFQLTRNLQSRMTAFSPIAKNGRVHIWTRTYTSKDTANKEYAVDQIQATIVITPPANVRAVPQTIIHLGTQKKRQTSIFSIPTISFRNIIPISSTVFKIAMGGTSRQLQMMLSRGEASLNDCDPCGRSLINYALQGRNPSTLKFLLTKVEDVDAYEADGIEDIGPLIGLLLAIDKKCNIRERNERLMCLELMLHAEADPSVTIDLTRSWSVFAAELICATYDAVQSLLYLGQPFTCVNLELDRVDGSITLLLLLANLYRLFYLENLHLHEKIFLFLQHGAEVHARSPDGLNCLHWVLTFTSDLTKEKFRVYQEQELKDVLMCMVTSGVNVFASDNNGMTVSQVACGSGHEELWREVLSECGYDPDEVFCLEDDFNWWFEGNEKFPGMSVFPAISPNVRPTKLSFKEYSQQRKSLECVQKVYNPEFIDIGEVYRESDEFWESINESSDSEGYEWVSDDGDEEEDEDEGDEESEDEKYGIEYGGYSNEEDHSSEDE